MFDQYKLALGMGISEEDLDVAHDGAEGNKDCAGQYHWRICAY